MKALFILLFISSYLTTQAQRQNFVVIGRIMGNDSSKKATFVQWDIGRADTVPIQDGQFVFKGSARHPYLASIGTDRLRSGLGVWLSNDTIRATFKAVQGILQPVDVSGPPETVDYLTNINQTNAFRSSTLSQPQKNQQVADLVSQYVHKHPMSYYSLFLVMGQSKALGVSQSKDLMASLSPIIQQSDLGKTLAKQLLNEEATTLNKTLTNFSLPDTSGTLHTVLPAQKPYTLLSFWASWCAPCRLHNRQDLAKLYHRLDHSQVELISISLDDNRAAWLKAIVKDKMSWLQLSDLKYLSSPLAKELAIFAVPQFLLVNNANKIVATDLDSAIRLIDKK